MVSSASKASSSSETKKKLDRVSSNILFGFNRKHQPREDVTTRDDKGKRAVDASAGPSTSRRPEGRGESQRAMASDPPLPPPPAAGTHRRRRREPVREENKDKPTLLETKLAASASGRTKRSGDVASDSDSDNGGRNDDIAALEACVRNARTLVFSVHNSESNDHSKGVSECLSETQAALEAYQDGGSGRRKSRKRTLRRERETRALCDAIKLQVLAALWHHTYTHLKTDKDSIILSLAHAALSLLETNLSVNAGKQFTDWTVLPVQKYVRQLRDGIRLEEACRYGSASATKREDETEIQRALELLNFNLETDKENHKRAMINSTSWEDQARHALLRSSVVERRTSHLVDLAGREVEALRLEDDLTKLLAKADRSQSSIERIKESDGEATDGGKVEGKVGGDRGLSLRDLQGVLRRGEALTSSFFVQNSAITSGTGVTTVSRRRSARLKSLLSVGEALLRCRCALERRGLRSKFEWPGYWLGDDGEHFEALRRAEDGMRESMWSLLGIPENGKRALLECGRQVYATVRGEYEVQLRWDLERLDEMMGNGGGGDGVFAYDEYRSKNLRAHFVESSAIVIQTAFRAYRARRDVGKVLREQREKLRKMKGDEAAAITIQRHARKMLSRKRTEEMRLFIANEDRVSIRRFTTMSPARLLKALLEEMTHLSQKGKISANEGEKSAGQGKSHPRWRMERDWCTQSTPFELASLVIKTSPVPDICRAMEQVPRECWEACALLLDKAPVSLAVAVLSKISKKYLKAEVLMTLPVRTQASVLREMQERNSNLNFKDILSVMDNPDIVELCASFAQIEESRILGILILETCYALDRLEAIGRCYADHQLRMGSPPATTANLVEHLRPYTMLQFVLGIKARVKGEAELQRMLSRVSKGAAMLMAAMTKLYAAHGESKVFSCHFTPAIDAFDYQRALNSLIHCMRSNGYLEHALAGLTQLTEDLEREDESNLDIFSAGNFHRQGIRILSKQMAHTVSPEQAGLLLNWIAKWHDMDLATVLHSLASNHPEYVSEVLSGAGINLDLVARGLVVSEMASFAAMVLLSCKDRVTSEHFLEALVEASQDFAREVSKAIAETKK